MSSIVQRLTLAISSLVGLSLLTACGGSAKAVLQLNKQSPATLTALSAPVNASTEAFPSEGTAVTPTVFQMKIIQAYLAEDIDASQNNVGKVQRVWVHPDCADPNSCSDASIGYFDLIDPTAANQKLNSQNLDVDLGTYRYVKLDFCVGSAKGNNVKYKSEHSAEVETTYGGCGVTSARMEPPIVLKKGDTVKIALDYDFTKGPLYSMPNGSSCTTSSPCLGGIELTPRLLQ